MVEFLHCIDLSWIWDLKNLGRKNFKGSYLLLSAFRISILRW